MYGLPQISMMMALGLYVFGLYTVPYQQLQRQMSWRHPANSRIGKRPARQFLGPVTAHELENAIEASGGKVR